MPIDMSGAKAPPRKVRQARTPAPVVQEKSMRELRDEGLQGIGALTQGLCNLGGLYADGGAIGMYWPGMASEVAKLADEYEVIAKPVDILIKVGPFGALIALGMPLVMQIMANHRMIDATKVVGGKIVPPEILEAQMKAQIMRQQAEAQREQMEALREAQLAQAEYEKVLAEVQGATPGNGKANDATPVAV